MTHSRGRGRERKVRALVPSGFAQKPDSAASPSELLFPTLSKSSSSLGASASAKHAAPVIGLTG